MPEVSFKSEDIDIGYNRYLLRNLDEYKSEVPLSLDKALIYEAYGLSED